MIPLQIFMKGVKSGNRICRRHSVSPDRYRKTCLSVPVAYRMVDALQEMQRSEEAIQLRRLIDSDLVFHRVTKIEKLEGNYQTYDFTVEAGNLITNGLLSHNSSGMKILEDTGSTEVVQFQLGHSSIVTTQGYAKIKGIKAKEKLGRINWRKIDGKDKTNKAITDPTKHDIDRSKEE
jgi:hypothetical protein